MDNVVSLAPCFAWRSVVLYTRLWMVCLRRLLVAGWCLSRTLGQGLSDLVWIGSGCSAWLGLGGMGLRGGQYILVVVGSSFPGALLPFRYHL